MKIYEKSKRIFGAAEYFICREGNKKYLGIHGTDENTEKFCGEISHITGDSIKLCELSEKNAQALRALFPFTRPVRNPGRDISIGLGDRLGLATPGHIRLIKEYDIFPVFAQQSIRELNLTGRTFEGVLAAASFAVFQEGYEAGFGADGDHLKTREEVRYALESGFTMITLDCSEHIRNIEGSLVDKYNAVGKEKRERLEKRYPGKKFMLKSGLSIGFDSEALMNAAVTYLGAIDHIEDIFRNVIGKINPDVDFEISIDETVRTTSPQDHYFVAGELTERGVGFTGLAPKFCGEFQKGIDYIGNIGDFRKEFREHAMIADEFGYRISVHSGSDKLSVYPYISEYTGKRFHVKTAGTNWLEAVRTVAVYDPVLYRDMHRHALRNICEAKKYYHISANTDMIPDVGTLKDSELPGLMDANDSRQLLHITYGLILRDQCLKNRIYGLLFSREDEYCAMLIKHIGRHISALGL